jgi:hypothetical protein
MERNTFLGMERQEVLEHCFCTREAGEATEEEGRAKAPRSWYIRSVDSGCREVCRDAGAEVIVILALSKATLHCKANTHVICQNQDAPHRW